MVRIAKEVIHMNNRIVLGYDGNNPLIECLDGILYFSESELKVARLIDNCRSDEEIAKILKISEIELGNIKRKIREQAKQIVRGY